MSWQQQVKKHVMNDELKKAFDVFNDAPGVASDSTTANTLILLRSQYARAERDQLNGVISNSNYGIAMAKVRSGIMSLLGNFPDTEPEAPPERRPGKPPSNGGLLFLAANPTDTAKLRLAEEFAKVHAVTASSDFTTELHQEFATSSERLLGKLLEHRPSYVHFAGHGVEEVADFHAAGILLRDDENKTVVFPASALADLVGNLSGSFPIELVLLNACDTAEHARLLSERGVTAIGMRDKLPDDDALTFATSFYMSLAANGDIQLSFNLAKTMVMAKHPGKEPVPQLFTAG